MLNDLAQSWLDAKAAEAAAVTHRRDLENKLASLIGISETLEGVETVETDAGFRIKIAGRMNRKVNGERIQEIAEEAGLTAHLSSLFRWKPEINMTAWKGADKSITGPLLGGITTTPGRASFSITKDE